MDRSRQELNTNEESDATNRSSFWNRFLGIAQKVRFFHHNTLFSCSANGQTSDLGRLGEESALRFLKRQGYRLLMRNFRTPQGEVDLVMRHKRTVVFVEVKTRNSEEFIPAEHLITPQKQTRISFAAKQFIHRNQLTRFPARFDVVIIVPGEKRSPRIRHYPNAFTL